jgi:hypothetical protein
LKLSRTKKGLHPLTPFGDFLWYSVAMDDSTGQSNSWVEEYDARYEYGGKGLALVLPIVGLLGIFLARESGAALAVACGTEVLFILVFFEWKTYFIRIRGGSITRALSYTVRHSLSRTWI